MNGRNRILAAAALAAAVAAGAGCAPQLDRIEVGVQENRDEVARMQAENRRLLQEVQALGQLLRMDRDAGDESSAMRLAKLEQVSTRLDQLLRKLDDNAQYMRDLSARVDLLATRSGLPTLGEYKPPVAGAGAETLPEEGRAILEAAELDRSRGNLELARSGFAEFLARYPRAEAVDRAVYWLGDLAYGEGEHEAALVRFREVIDDHPDSELRSAALAKARACLLALGRKDEAWSMGTRLLEEYPQSDEAAQLRLERGDG
ncbi:MAG: tetratricopeptide repeat protein [Candidatus Krumholzibacteriia bacterium]